MKFNGNGRPFTGSPLSISFSASVFGGGSGIKICLRTLGRCRGIVADGSASSGMAGFSSDNTG